MTPLVLLTNDPNRVTQKPTGLVMRERWRCTYPVLIIVLRLGLNDVQPLIYTQKYIGNQLPEYSGVFTLI